MKLLRIIITSLLAISYLKAVESTIETKCSEDKKTVDEQASSVFSAINRNDPEKLDELLNSIDANISNQYGVTPLGTLVMRRHDSEELLRMIDVLIKHKANVNYQNPENGITILMWISLLRSINLRQSRSTSLQSTGSRRQKVAVLRIRLRSRLCRQDNYLHRIRGRRHSARHQTGSASHG